MVAENTALGHDISWNVDGFIIDMGANLEKYPVCLVFHQRCQDLLIYSVTTGPIIEGQQDVPAARDPVTYLLPERVFNGFQQTCFSDRELWRRYRTPYKPN